jgi:hypothetical protein
MGKGTYDELDSTQIARRWFFGVAICAQVAGLIAFILIVVLLGHYRGGFEWGVSLFVFFFFSRIYRFCF